MDWILSSNPCIYFPLGALPDAPPTSPEARMKLAGQLKLTRKSKPTRRVWIPKPGKNRPSYVFRQNLLVLLA